MKIRVIGGGWYGCHIALTLKNMGYQVELHESADRLFAGASGANPARLHCGAHYPRSRLTRAACADHLQAFMSAYGHLTRGIPVNIYAVAQNESLVDFENYVQTLKSEIEFIKVYRPHEFGLRNVEGAIMTGERHILIRLAREFFTSALGDSVHLLSPAGEVENKDFDINIDCTFCSFDAEAIDRYEPCVVGILEGPTDKAVTIMDGPFPSIYPWDEQKSLLSITSAKWTPLSKSIKSYGEARQALDETSPVGLQQRVQAMMDDMARFWPDAVRRYKIVAVRTAIRAMPKSGADSRLVDVVKVGDNAVRVRAGKIDAVFRAMELITEDYLQ